MVKTYYSVGINYSEAMLGGMDLYRIMRETEACMTTLGSDEDPKLYVLYKSMEDRDAGLQALRDRFRSARFIYRPHYINVEEAEENGTDNDGE